MSVTSIGRPRDHPAPARYSSTATFTTALTRCPSPARGACASSGKKIAKCPAGTVNNSRAFPPKTRLPSRRRRGWRLHGRHRADATRFRPSLRRRTARRCTSGAIPAETSRAPAAAPGSSKRIASCRRFRESRRQAFRPWPTAGTRTLGEQRMQIGVAVRLRKAVENHAGAPVCESERCACARPAERRWGPGAANRDAGHGSGI